MREAVHFDLVQHLLDHKHAKTKREAFRSSNLTVLSAEEAAA